MANTILTPGEENIEQTPVEKTTPYLERDNYLSEFQTEEEKAVVRENLNVYSKDSVYNRTESDTLLDRTIKEAFDKYLNMDDPHGILPTVEEMIEGVVRNDGSTPFLVPQQGVDPVQDFHLATKRFVTRLLKEHVDTEDPHRILPEVEDMLEQYVKQSQVYLKNQLYTKNEIDQQSGQYIKKDGTTPFTKAQIGADPQIDSHLSTKRYVDAVMYKHLVDVDPHGFISILNKRLAAYAKTANVLDKTQTYSRVQIDSIVRSLVHDAAKEALLDHLNEFDPHNILAEVRKLKFIKQDGSVPFKNPQKGADAVDPQDLVTLHQLQDEIQVVTDQINRKECQWKTSGPVIGSAGLVKIGTEFANVVSFQEVMDAIFYGRGINIIATELVSVGESSEITVCVQGSLASFQHGELYQNGHLIQSFTKEDFEERSCITTSSTPITEDTEFVFKAFYVNGSVHDVSATTKLSLPMFVGLLPKWRFGNTVTYDYLIELSKEDPTNNKFYNKGSKLTELNHIYQFTGKGLQHIFVAMPEQYSNLYQIVTPSQQFGIDAFDIIDMIPFQVPGSNKDVIYKLYIYREAIVQLNNPVTFNFITNNE